MENQSEKTPKFIYGLASLGLHSIILFLWIAISFTKFSDLKSKKNSFDVEIISDPKKILIQDDPIVLSENKKNKNSKFYSKQTNFGNQNNIHKNTFSSEKTKNFFKSLSVPLQSAGNTQPKKEFSSDLSKEPNALLNTEELVHYSYYSRLYQVIAPIWKEEVSKKISLPIGKYTTEILAVFHKDGHLLKTIITTSSGYETLDEIAQNPWKKIEYFPNPPSEMINENNEVVTRWQFTVFIDPYTKKRSDHFSQIY